MSYIAKTVILGDRTVENTVSFDSDEGLLFYLIMTGDIEPEETMQLADLDENTDFNFVPERYRPLQPEQTEPSDCTMIKDEDDGPNIMERIVAAIAEHKENTNTSPTTVGFSNSAMEELQKFVGHVVNPDMRIHNMRVVSADVLSDIYIR